MREQLKQEIAQRARLKVEEVRADAHLVLELGLSSLDLLSVLAFAEQAFGAAFPDAVLGTLTSVEKIEAAVAQYRTKDGKDAP